jgi:hypothetical protein
MSDQFIGRMFISNNISVYDDTMMQNTYTSKFASRSKLFKSSDSDFPDLNQDLYKIKLVCNDEFERGSVLKILGVNQDLRQIYVEKVRESVNKINLPVMVFLIQTIGVHEGANYTFTPSNGTELVLVSSDIYKRSKFYGLVALVKSSHSVIIGRDSVSKTEVEWVMKYNPLPVV